MAFGEAKLKSMWRLIWDSIAKELDVSAQTSHTYQIRSICLRLSITFNIISSSMKHVGSILPNTTLKKNGAYKKFIIFVY